MINDSEPSIHSSCEMVHDSAAKGSKSKSGKTNETANSSANAGTAGGTDSRFSCNICFDEVCEPVVTRCGHLYCWPCLFQWLEPGLRHEERESLGMSSFYFGGGNGNPSRRVCPVCKAECPLSAIVPLYVRSSPSRKSRTKPSTSYPQTDGNKNELEGDANLSHSEHDRSAVDEGLRQRRRNGTSDNLSNNNDPIDVPNRPTYPQQHQEEPSSPPMSRRSSPGSSPPGRASTENPYRVGGVQITPRSPNGHNGSLTYGILASLHRATAEYYRNVENNTNNADGQDRRQIPSLHDRRNPLSNHHADGTGRFGASSQDYNERDGNLNSETTQYLSRLLIMFTSFVIFCFLVV